MKLWNIKDGQMALVEQSLSSGKYKLKCTVLKHAKNGKSVRVTGESFGIGFWLPHDCVCERILSEDEFHVELSKRFKLVVIDGEEYYMGIASKDEYEK